MQFILKSETENLGSQRPYKKKKSLPTKKNLLFRKVTRTATCDHCNEEVDDTIYALWACQVLKEVWWNEHYLRNQLSTRYVDFRDLWTVIINSEVPKLAERFAYVTWSIWHKRNATRMQSSSLPFNRIYQDMCDRLQEFQAAQELAIPEQIPAGPTHWSPSQRTQSIVNYDGALFHDTKQAGIGVVVRNSGGTIQGALSDRCCLPMTVDEVEALACRLAVHNAIQLGLEEAVFEGDSETITKALNSASPCLSSFGHIIDDVKSLALNFVSVSFIHVKRQGNAVANKLAKAAKFSSCPRFQLDDIPSDVQRLVLADKRFVD